MTERFMTALDAAGLSFHLVDRRFSNSLEQVGKPSLAKALSAFGLLARVIREVRAGPEIFVHFVTNRPFSLMVDFCISVILRLGGVPSIAYIHTNGYRSLAERSYIHRIVLNQLFRAYGRVVVLGDRLMEDMSDWFDADQIVKISNYAPIPSEPPRPRGPEEPIKVAFFSNMLREKGPIDFVKVALSCPAELRHRIEFIMVGATPDVDVLREIDELQPDRLPNFQRMGALDNDHRNDFLRSCDLLLFPSSYPYEAQPLSIIEAMSHGLGVIAYDVGGLGDLIEPGGNGYLVPSGDLSGLKKRLFDTCANPEVVSRLRFKSYERFAKEHTENKYVELWSELMDCPDL